MCRNAEEVKMWRRGNVERVREKRDGNSFLTLSLSISLTLGRSGFFDEKELKFLLISIEWERDIIQASSILRS